MKKSILVLMFAMSTSAQADTNFDITIKDHKFSPDVIQAPAKQKFTLTIKNLDSTKEEFESHELNREKIIPGGGTKVITLGPLEPGEYGFFGEFNPKTAQGKIVVK